MQKTRRLKILPSHRRNPPDFTDVTELEIEDYDILHEDDVTNVVGYLTGTMKTLTHLTIRGVDMNEYRTDRIVAKIVEILQGEQCILQHLVLSYCGIEGDAARKLCSAIGRNRSLGNLQLGGNDLLNANVFEIGQSVSLRKIDVYDAGIDDASAVLLFNEITARGIVQELSVRDNNIGGDGQSIESIFSMLRKTESLRVLDISSNIIKKDDMNRILEVLRTETENRLVEIRVGFNVDTLNNMLETRHRANMEKYNMLQTLMVNHQLPAKIPKHLMVTLALNMGGTKK